MDNALQSKKLAVAPPLLALACGFERAPAPVPAPTPHPPTPAAAATPVPALLPVYWPAVRTSGAPLTVR